LLSNFIRNKQTFKDACIDGDFLLELKEEDMRDILGVEHKLHRRKILLAREKLKPLSAEEELNKEAKAEVQPTVEQRSKSKVPDIDTVFSQARHGRLRMLEQSLVDGFDINTVDDRGNSLLLVAVQNGHRKMIDFLIRRKCNVNHTNINGNSPLHFALAYDKTGQIAEFLIEKGADDTIENNHGLTCYDGLGSDEEEP